MSSTSSSPSSCSLASTCSSNDSQIPERYCSSYIPTPSCALHEDLQPKIIQLFQNTWPGTKTAHIRIKKFWPTGGHNRIIRINVKAKTKAKSPRQDTADGVVEHTSGMSGIDITGVQEDKLAPGRYMLRFPYHDKHCWMEYEVAIISFLNTHFPLAPVPKIVNHSLTSENELGLRYMIQTRLPGSTVQDVYRTLNTTQKITFAWDFGCVLKELGSKSWPCSGDLNPNSDVNDPSFLPPDIPSIKPRCSKGELSKIQQPQKPQTTLQYILSTFERQYSRTNESACSPFHASRFPKIATALAELGLLNDEGNYIVHHSLHERNILVDITSSTTARVGGIIDWDSSSFQPAFMQCRPPQWLWGHPFPRSCRDERIRYTQPDAKDKQSIRNAFVWAVGERWMRLAYTPEYRIARVVLLKGINGFEEGECGCQWAKNTLEKWNAMRPEYAVETGCCEKDGKESCFRQYC
ncbi:hypothetical protein CC80DRAFT_552048 [Byssothecium circinans]|uniref:Aminoglycoside phosphotransferase domain-containing protein n=1 Tax=Byssothecium circinans TaxID=147558 RepID=A0A6A5TJ95_9PLEO|nr:hypothetical protein CC80DRAFT_552048 [Byssothecium circinans]